MAMFPDIWDWEKGKGRWIDKVSKPMIKKGLGIYAKRYEKLMDLKLKEGFINPEVEALYDCWNQFMKTYADSYTDGKPGADPNIPDPRRLMHENIRNVMCIMLDQDTHYLIEFFVLLSIIKGNYDKFLYRHRKSAYPDRASWMKYKALLMRRLDVDMAPCQDVSVNVCKIKKKKKDAH